MGARTIEPQYIPWEIQVIAAAPHSAGVAPSGRGIPDEEDFRQCVSGSSPCCLPGKPQLDFQAINQQVGVTGFLQSVRQFNQLDQSHSQNLAQSVSEREFWGVATLVTSVVVVGTLFGLYRLNWRTSQRAFGFGAFSLLIGGAAVFVAVSTWFSAKRQISRVEADFERNLRMTDYFQLPRRETPCLPWEAPPFIAR